MSKTRVAVLFGGRSPEHDVFEVLGMRYDTHVSVLHRRQRRRCSAYVRTPVAMVQLQGTVLYVKWGHINVTLPMQRHLAQLTLDKAINTPNVPAQIKSVAESLKAEIAKHKPAAPAAPAGSTPPATAPPASSAPPAPHH